MKKIMYSMLAFMMAAFTLTSCEDVPAPYEIPGGGNGGGGTELPEGTFFEQDFSTSLGDFTQKSASGNIQWAISYSSACITGYADWDGSGTKTNQAGVTYLISPEIDLTKAETAHVELNHAMRYENGDINTNNSLLITDNYTGDATTTTWTQLKYGTDGLNGTAFDFVTSSANIPATFVGKKVVVALRHTCGDKSSTWEVKNLNILTGNVDAPSTPDTPTTGEAKGDGTKENPFNSVAANKFVSSLESGAETDKEYYIKGKICEVKNAYAADNYGNATFYISDDGTATDKFYCFRVLYLGNVKYTEGTNIAVGDEVVVCAKLVNYMGNTPETVGNAGYLVELKSNGGSSDTPAEDLKGDVVYAASSCGLANAEALTSVTVSDDVTLTFESGGNSQAPKYYTSGTSFRMYPKNTMKFTSKKKIASVTIQCNEANGSTYNASGDVTSTAGTVATEGKNITISGIDATEFTFADASATTGAASQVRVQKIAITFAK